MKAFKTTRKVHLVFKQDDNGHLHVLTTEASMKDAEPGIPAIVRSLIRSRTWRHCP